MLKKIYFLLFLLLSCTVIISQDTPRSDSLILNHLNIEQDNPIVAAMDSMLSHYKSLDKKMLNDSFLHATSHQKTPFFEDSILKQRLQSLDNNTPFSFDFNPITRRYIRLYEKRRTSVGVFLTRKETYFKIFEEKLLQYKLPLELKYLPIVESALKPDAESWAGAAGLWQFMYNTGKRYGLEADSYIDLRKDPYLSTEAACKHLKRLYNIYGNWELVLAAYNAGGGNVNKAIRRSGGKKNYWEIYSYLPQETQGYVPAFIAVNYMMNHAPDYNIKPINPLAQSSQIDTVVVSKRVDFLVVSKFLDIPINYLTSINPTYYLGIIPKRDKKFNLYLPQNKIGRFLTNDTAIYRLSEELKKEFKVPEQIAYKGKRIKYRVKSGDFLGKISEKYGCKVKEIKKWNNLRGTNLKVGQLLVIYSTKKTKSKSKKNKKIHLKEGEKYTYYTIKKGDTLWEISNKYPGVSIEDIKEHNEGLSSNNLKLGKTIKIIQRG